MATVFKRKERSVTVALVSSVARTNAVTLTAHSLLAHNAGTYCYVHVCVHTCVGCCLITKFPVGELQFDHGQS